MIKIFGTALDALDIFERVDVKMAYMNWLKSQPTFQEQEAIDPYCYLEQRMKGRNPAADEIEWIGAFPVESWLTPKPCVSDFHCVSAEKYTRFLEQNGCYEYYRKLIAYLFGNIGSDMPVMIGVDHSMTGAAVTYLKTIYDHFNILIFDSHCDLLDSRTWKTYLYGHLEDAGGYSQKEEIYECGNFLRYMLQEGVINPEELWICGAQDVDELRHKSPLLYAENVLPWIRRGVHILSKEELLRDGIPERITGQTYLSFDMDLGSVASVLATRFVNHIGISAEEFLNLIHDLSKLVNGGIIEPIGLDIMEMDVHFLDAEIGGKRDYTGRIATAIIDEMIYGPFKREGRTS